MIPKIIHQTWKNKNLSIFFEKNINNIKNLHKDWEYKFWTDEDCIKLIKIELPNIYPLIDKCENNGQKADIFRYAIIYLFGGFYFDLDFFFLKPINTYINLNKHNLCFFYESAEYSPFFYGKNITIANCILGSEKNNLFFKRLLDSLNYNIPLELVKANYCGGKIKDPFFTLIKTGPIYLTYMHEISRDIINKYDIFYGDEYLYINKMEDNTNDKQKISIHMCMNSWYKSESETFNFLYKDIMCKL